MNIGYYSTRLQRKCFINSANKTCGAVYWCNQKVFGTDFLRMAMMMDWTIIKHNCWGFLLAILPKCNSCNGIPNKAILQCKPYDSLINQKGGLNLDSKADLQGLYKVLSKASYRCTPRVVGQHQYLNHRP